MLLTISFSIFFILFGLVTILYKPYYNPNEKVHLKKVVIAQGILFLILGLLFYPLYFITGILELKQYLPFLLLFLLLISAYFNKNFQKWYTEEDISKHNYKRETYQQRSLIFKKYIYVVMIIVAIIIFFIITKMPKIKFRNNELEIEGIYGMEKELNEIIVIDTINIIPEIKSIDDGISLFNITKGNFYIKNDEKVKMFIYKHSSPIIYIEYKRAHKLYFNFQNPEETRIFYNELLIKKEKGLNP